MNETYIPGFSQQLMRSASAPAGYATGGNVRLATPEETAKAVKNVTAVSQSDPIYKNASALEAGTPVYYLPNPAAGSMYKDQTPITADGRTYELTDKTGKVVFTAKTDAELKQLVDLVNNEYNADKTTAAWNVRVAQARPTMVARRGNLEDFSGGVRRVAQGKLTPVQQYDTIAGAIPDPNTFAKWAAIALPMAGGIALGPALAGGLGVGSAVGTGLGTALGSTAAGTIAGKSIGDILKGALISGGLAYGGASLLGGGSPTPSGGDALETIMNAPVTFGGDAGALASGTLGGAAGSVGGSTAGTDALGNFIQVVVPKAGGTVGGALGGVLASYPNLNGTAQTPFQQNPPTQQQPQQQETPTDGNEIVVTAKPKPIDLGGLPGSVISNLPPSLVTDITGAPQGPLSQEQVTQEQPAETTNENEIVVTAKPKPIDLGGLPGSAISNLPSSLLNNLPSTPQGPLSQETPADTAEEGWEVKGKTETPLPVTPPPGGYTSGYDPITNTITAVAETPKPISDAEAALVPAVPPLNSVDIPANAGDVQPVDKKTDLDKIIDYLRLAGLGVSTIGSLFGKGGDGGTPISVGRGSLNPVFSAQLPSANLPGLTGGATGPRPASALPQTTQDWYRYGYGPEQSFFNYVPQTAANTSQAYTGYAVGGYAVGGPGDGRDDKIPAMLSDGEYVIDAETVAMLGNGSSKAGAEALDNFRVNVRKHKGRQLAKGQFSVKAKKPEQYLKGRK